MQYAITEDTLGLLLSRYKFSKAIEDLVLHLLNDMNIGKAAGTDNISGEYSKRVLKHFLKTLTQFYFSLWYLRSLKRWFMTKHKNL